MNDSIAARLQLVSDRQRDFQLLVNRELISISAEIETVCDDAATDLPLHDGNQTARIAEAVRLSEMLLQVLTDAPTTAVSDATSPPAAGTTVERRTNTFFASPVVVSERALPTSDGQCGPHPGRERGAT